MLGFMKDDVEVGYYNAATKIKNILVSIVTSLGTVLMPRASYYLQNGMKDEFYKLSKKSNQICLSGSDINDDLLYVVCQRRGFCSCQVKLLKGPSFR